jgi:hypothetical protein
MHPRFTNLDTWAGGFYELSMELPAQDDATTARALTTLWLLPQLAGCYARNDIEPSQQVALDLAELPIEGHLYGIAILPDGHRCVCGSYTTHFASDGRWLNFYLPMAALEKLYPVGGYPFGPATPELAAALTSLNEWFRTVAEGVYQRFAFAFGVIGFETDYVAVKTQTLDAIPEERWDGLLIPKEDGLIWYPPTEYGSQFT